MISSIGESFQQGLLYRHNKNCKLLLEQQFARNFCPKSTIFGMLYKISFQ